jgi:hypothetical protein
MSKFDELCEAYVSARKGFFARRSACAAFARAVLEGMEQYLGCPPFQLYFIPSNYEPASIKTRTAEGAISCADDGRWRFAIGLSLRESQDTTRKDITPQTVRFELVLRPTDSGYAVRLKGWDDEFVLPATDGTAAHTAFYEFIFQRVRESYLGPDQRFLENVTESQRQIGG